LFLISDPTIEDAYRKQVEVDGQLCILEIEEDTEQGLDEPNSLLMQYVRSAHAFILVYSITDTHSFDFILNLRNQMFASEWFSEEQRPIVVVGSKSDLQEMRKVPYEDGQKFAQTIENCEFLETSAKEGTNVDEAFKCITRKLLKKYRKEKNIQKNGASCVLS